MRAIASPCAQVNLYKFTCAQFRPTCFAFVLEFFGNIQLKSYGMQYMQLIIAQFLSTTKLQFKLW